MEAYQSRVIVERNELGVKIQALLNFINAEGFKLLPAEENQPLLEQSKYMRDYYAVLNKRIESWNLPDEEPFLTEGEYRVGISFNPGGHDQVNHIKREAASLIDYVLANGKDGRTAAMAATGFEQSCTDAVKSITKPERPEHLK